MTNHKLNLSSSFTITLICFLLPFLLFVSSTAKNSPSDDPICNSTPYPSLCKSNHPNNNPKANVYDYGRFSLSKSLLQARAFLSLIENLQRGTSIKTSGAIEALKDCHLLTELNVDFLSYCYQMLDNGQTLSPSNIDYVHSLLSATLTNTQTCLDSMEETASSWKYKSGVSIPLSNDTELYSVSLALFKNGWVHKTNKGPSYLPKRLGAFKNGRSQAFKMSAKNKAIFDKIRGHGRKILQATNSGGDYVVVNDIVVVSKDGSGNFTTINEALAVAPNNSVASDGYFLIYVTAGVYEEYVSIPKNNKYLMVIGDGINQTVITGNHSVAGGFTTFNSATFAVVGQGFVAMNLTIRNTAGAIMNQAVALRNDADMSTFYSCSFEGYQDTLYTHSQRQFYTECDIYGTVDFIFGNAAAVFQNCNIYPRLPLVGQFNTITAQGRTDLNQNTGITIQNCTIRPAHDLASSSAVQTYLGRPWKQYSRTIVMETFMDKFINSAGWSAWSGDFALSTLYYAEFNNFGTGSNTRGRVKWPGYHIINANVAANFTVSNFISGDDWLPQTGVSYSSSL